MKILVIALDGAAPESLFGDDRLENFRRLMDAGCFGPLEGPIPPAGVLPAGGGTVIGGGGTDLSPPRAVDEILLRHESREHFAAARHAMKNADWDSIQLNDTGLDRLRRGSRDSRDPTDSVRDHYRQLDDEVGSLLELLDDETAVLVVSGRTDPDGHGAFILVAPGRPARGAVEGAQFRDIAPTLLDLGGHDRPASLMGRSIAADWPSTPPDGGLPASDEMLVRERLHGLGYLG